jgi:hypothetical protein
MQVLNLFRPGLQPPLGQDLLLATPPPRENCKLMSNYSVIVFWALLILVVLLASVLVFLILMLLRHQSKVQELNNQLQTKQLMTIDRMTSMVAAKGPMEFQAIWQPDMYQEPQTSPIYSEGFSPNPASEDVDLSGIEAGAFAGSFAESGINFAGEARPE